MRMRNMIEEANDGNSWVDEGEEELVRELLDDESPFFLLPNQSNSIHRIISTVYSGPTIQDIDKALSITTHSLHHQPISQSRGLSKIENNKYTLKLKTCGNGMDDDGYKWRKYGQKSIKNSLFPRSYYRCTNPRCSAKKQVERSSEEEDTLIITYEGLHLHFAYPYLVMDPQLVGPPTKKQKVTVSGSQGPKTAIEAQESLSTATTGKNSYNVVDDCSIHESAEAPPSHGHGEGLLEDVVPFVIRNPSNNNNNNNSNNASSISSTCSSCPSPPTSTNSSFTRSPIYSSSCFDVGITAIASIR